MSDFSSQHPTMRVDDGKSPHEISSLVREFIAMMQAGNISRLELEYGDLKVALRAHERDTVQVVDARVGPVSPAVDVNGHEPSVLGDYAVTAPMIGTYYTAPAPNEPPFVQPGDRVEEGQTIGIIEAMKIMNEIAADRAGTVVEIIAQNGQTVEYGSPLVRLSVDPN